MPRPAALSAAHVRRAVLHAQGLTWDRPTGRIDRRHLRKVVDRFGVVQLDSVNVLARAHLMPFFSRLGPWDPDLLDRMAYDDHELFEYWGHEASLLEVGLHPHLRWRMGTERRWRTAIMQERPELIARIEQVIHAHGPLTTSDLADHLGVDEQRSGAWWGWGDTKRAVEALFHAGRVGAVRVGNFERAYCAPEVAVPPEIVARPTPDEATAKRTLVARAVRGHGVATAKDLADVWRLLVAEVKTALAELVEDGEVVEVTVEDWTEPAYAPADLVIPREVDVARLVSPFDPAMWCRPRVERIHDFSYRIEIYVPAAERTYGYYTLPFLCGDTLVGRIDLKADRDGRRLLVRSAHAEPDLDRRGTDPAQVAEALAAELAEVARWLDLDDVAVARRGALAPLLLERPDHVELTD